MLSEMFGVVKEKLRRMFCGHERPSYEEIRTEDENGKVFWSSCIECADCGEILHVNCSYHGEPDVLADALKRNEGVR